MPLDAIIRDDVTKWPVIATVIVVIAALTVLLGGWVLGSDTLRSLSPSFAAMVPSTAISFLLTGPALLWAQLSPPATVEDTAFLKLTAAVVATVALTDLVIGMSGGSPGLDALIWPVVRDFSYSTMAPMTSVCFLLASVCLYRLSLIPYREDLLFVVCGTAGLLFASIAAVGYIFGAHALYDGFIFTAMALHTALTFILLFGTLLLMRRDIGWLRVLNGSGRGSAGARRLFPVVLVAPVLLCLVALIGTESGLWTANFRLSVLAILMTVVLAATVLRNAVIENAAERKLLDTMDRLQVAISDRELLLREVYHRVKNNLEQVNALLHFEAARIVDPEAKRAFENTTGRIHALSTVHRLLISSPTPSKLGTAEFLRELCASIADSHDASGRGISLEVVAADLQVDLDVAVTLGLMVNELVTNAMKHAFCGRRTGRVQVRFEERGDGRASLVVADDGIGVGNNPPAGQSATGVGSRIIRGLAAQLKGELAVDGNDGSRVEIVMEPRSGNRERYE